MDFILNPIEPVEAYFSSRPCPCCCTFLAGDRIDCQVIDRDSLEVWNEKAGVCIDCYTSEA